MMRLLIGSCHYLILFLPVTVCFTLQSPSICIRNSNGCQSLSLSKSPSPSLIFHTQDRRSNRLISFASESDFLDVEFEKSSLETKQDADDAAMSSEDDNNGDDLSALLGTSKSLIDVSLETGDPRWKETRVPFCRGTEFIDCKLAFMVDLEGQSYGIAVPFDDVVAIVVQEKEGKNKKNSNNANIKTKNIDPDSYEDNEEYAELMEIFAGQVQEQLGEEFQLRKTPKVLTISGGLDKITKDWQNKVITKPFDVEELLEMSKEKDKDDIDKELNSFYKFMKDELGDKEFEKTMNSNDDGNSMGAELNELMGLFDVPGADGTKKEDMEGLEELMKSMEKDIETGEVSEANEFIPDTENAALKLLGYTFTESGKSYFLVKPLQSYTLIGRHVKDEEDVIRFELLSPEEEKVIIPKLEEMCQKDLEANGLKFPSSNAKDAAKV